MTYDYIKKMIPEKRPFFTVSNGTFALSSGMLLVLENDDTNEWYNAIVSAIDRFVSGDYGNYYEPGDVICMEHEYGSYESPFGDTLYDGSIVIHAENHIDSMGIPSEAVIFFWHER